MWLTSSSIGRKFVMAITGVCLVLFVTFHVLMNAVALLWPAAYNDICGFLGANWYALVGSMGLAALFIIHIIYALWLTLQNRRARGTDRYAVTSRPPQVEWSSKNMLVLGIVVLAFLVVHMTQFWAKMQLQEVISHDLTALPVVGEVPASPEFGTLFLQLAFEQWWTPVVYIIGFVALWFHLNHGFWSMFHTVGWDNNIWLKRLKTIGCWWTSIVVLLFIAQAVTFTVQARQGYYTKDMALQEQYAEFWGEQAEQLVADINAKVGEIDAQHKGETEMELQNLKLAFFVENGPAFLEKAKAIQDYMTKQCPDVKNENTQKIIGAVRDIDRTVKYAEQMNPTIPTNQK